MNQRPQVFDPTLNRFISFRPVEFERDVERLHSWHNEEHVIPYWQQNMSLPEYKAHLATLLADTHQTLWIGEIDDVPMSYWETYWAEEDNLRNYYESQPSDQGVHLLIGKPEYLGKGYALPMLRTIVEYLFLNRETNQVVTEPDARNEKMIHIFSKCGFESVERLSLPDKEAQLMICNREEFQRRWEGSLHDTNV